MVRKMAYVGFSYLLGLLFASFFFFKINTVAAVLILIVLIAACFIDKKHLTVYVCCICFGIGTIFYWTYEHQVYNNIIKYDGQVVTVNGVITSFTLYSGDMCQYEIKGSINNETSADIVCFGSSRLCSIGDNIAVTGKIKKPDNTFLFNSESYYKGKGIYLEISYPESIYITDGNAFPVKRQLISYREYIYDRMYDYLNVEQMAIVKAMLFGDKSSMEDTTKTLLYRAGIGHIMAVSGVHLTVISSVIWFMLCQLPINKYIRLFILIAVTGMFVILSGMSNSVIRAAIMLFIVYSGYLFNRRSDVMNSLGIAAIILTADCPFVVRDASFLLSFAGVIGISTVAPAIISYLEEKIELGKIAKSLIVSASVSATVFPISFMFFDEVSVVSPVSNILLMPVCTVILICGMLVTCTGGIGLIAFPILKLCGICCNIVTVISTVIGGMNYAYIPLGYEFINEMILIAAAFILLITIICRNSKAVILSTVSAFSVCIAVIMCYRFVPADNITVALLSNGKGASSLVIHDNRSASVIDLRKGGQAHEYIKKYLNQRGIFIIDMLVMGVDEITSPVTYKNNLELFDIRTAVITTNGYADEKYISSFSDRIMYYDNTIDTVIEMPDYDILLSENNTVYVELNNYKIIAYNGATDIGIEGTYDIAIEYYGKKPAKYINCDTFIYLDENSQTPENSINYQGELFKIKIYKDKIETEAINNG